MDGGVTVRLEVYLPFRGQRTWRGAEHLAPGMTAGVLPAELGLDEPDLAVLVNGRHVPDETLLQPDDDVAVLRRAEGGCIDARSE